MKVAGPWLDGIGPDDCWLWIGRSRTGRFRIDRETGERVRVTVTWDYGRIRDGLRMRGTHVVAYELANGPVPPGLEVAHSCHTGLCCNPGHLVAQTHLENVRASVERARRRRGEVAA
jgi:hypothetical protein